MNSKPVVLLFLVFFLMFPNSVIAMETTEIGSISGEGATQIQNALDASGIPSAQMALIIDDSLIWARGYGDQPSLNTVFRIGSITKTFVAAAFVKLNESGMINLDDDVSDYLPFEVRNPNDPAKVITIRMILEHKAGMEVYYQFNQPWISSEMLQLLDTLNYTPAIPVPDWNGVRLPLSDIINSTNINDLDLWLPSTGGYSYSNTGYFFLSFLLEHITNNTWSDYINETVLSPLGMNSTRFNVTEYEQPVASPHLELDNGTLVTLPVYRDYGYGAGGMMTTVTDLSKFIIAIMNGGMYGGTQVFHPNSVSLMKQYLHQHGSMLGYDAQFSTLYDERGSLGVILFDNWREGNSAFIWSALVAEGDRLLDGDVTTTTTTETATTTSTISTTTETPPTTPGTNLSDFMLVGVAAGGIVVVIALLLVIRSRP